MTEISTTSENIYMKAEELKQHLRSLENVAVAFSGGVDSSFLLKVAQEVLGDRVIAITAVSCSFPEREFQEAAAFCEKMGIRQFFYKFDIMKVPGFCKNPPDRCYLCKKELFRNMARIAQEQDIQCVAEGSNMDDMGDYRPGVRAVSGLGIRSPLREAGLYKEEVRTLSREMGLPTWEKPSFACLSSRFAYGERITEEKLAMVEQAEELLFEKGFRQARVRIHDRLARIEVMPGEQEKLMVEDIRKEIVSKFRSFGFAYVSMDLEGYRTGSMNETL